MTSVWPLAGIVCCANNVSPQTEQCLPSVKPDSVHVAATAASMTSACPLAGIVCCATKISPQTEQCLPSVNPDSVHVAVTAASMTSACPLAGIVCCANNVSPQTEQCFPSVNPDSVHVAETASSTTSVCNPIIFENSFNDEFLYDSKEPQGTYIGMDLSTFSNDDGNVLGGSSALIVIDDKLVQPLNATIPIPFTLPTVTDSNFSQ